MNPFFVNPLLAAFLRMIYFLSLQALFLTIPFPANSNVRACHRTNKDGNRSNVSYLLGRWRLVLDRAPREQQQLPASLIDSAPGSAGGVTICGGAGGAGVGREFSGICARPAACGRQRYMILLGHNYGKAS